MKENLSKSCLYDVYWQALRVSMLAKYNNYGGFGTVEGVTKNINTLQEYLVPDRQERFYRNWRALNLMNATLLGYGTKMSGTEQERLIIEYRNELSARHQHLLLQGFTWQEWDWDKVRTDLEVLYNRRTYSFRNIRANLTTRKRTADRKEARGIGGMWFRTELQHFLTLMDEVEERSKVSQTKVLERGDFPERVQG